MQAAFPLNIASTLLAAVIGAVNGAALGAVLRRLTTVPDETSLSMVTAIVAAVLARIAVVIAFARKSSVQPIVSIEEFWGGALIGVSVGYLRFDQFLHLFTIESSG